LFHRPLSPRRVALWGLAVVAALQAVIVVVVSTIAWLKRRNQPQGFPHERIPDATAGENRLQVFGYGRELFDAMLAAIDAAEESIYLETFIWKGDAVGQEFKEHLARKADAGVDVYVIFDAFGNLVVPSSFKRFPPSIHALEYRAIRRPWQALDPGHYALEHRKVLVVDGKVGFTGGYNLGSLYATQWRDTHVRVEGPGAAQLAQLFVYFWDDHQPRDEHITRHYPRQFDPLFVPRGNDALRLAFPIRDMYIAAIDRAERCIRITNAYFVPDRALLASMTAAAARGVDVQVLLPRISNHTVADWMARRLFAECLDAGIRIFRYNVMIHAKTCTIDGQWSTIGSANLDRLSSLGNYELNVEIYSDELAQEMEQLFEQDKAYSVELTRAEWSRRPWIAKAAERILSPLRILV
jgi:cardiolipin synthase